MTPQSPQDGSGGAEGGSAVPVEGSGAPAGAQGVTDADRDAAIRAWTAFDASYDKAAALARIFAEERAKARAPYEEAIDAVLAYCNEIDEAELFPGLADTGAIRTRLDTVDPE